MKKSFSFSVIHAEKSCCCKSSSKKDCCKSKKITLKKIKDDYVSSNFQFKSPIVSFVLYKHATMIVAKSPFIYIVKSTKEYNPPEPPVPLSILYRSILI